MTDPTKPGLAPLSLGAAYAAFNCRDRYYLDCAELLWRLVNATSAFIFESAVDLGAGIGISTRVLLKNGVEEVHAVEPDPSMRQFLEVNLMGDPHAEIVEGRAETLATVIDEDTKVDLIFAAQVMHMLHTGADSKIPLAFEQAAKCLNACSYFAFDLGPSSYTFDLPLADHRSAEPPQPGQIMTELCHPLYRRSHEIMFRIIREEYPDFTQTMLWPDASNQMTKGYLEEVAKKAGFGSLTVTEELMPISGDRVSEFIRNGWSVFFRRGELSKLPMDRKLELVGKMMNELLSGDDIEALTAITAYHPTAVVIAEFN